MSGFRVFLHLEIGTQIGPRTLQPATGAKAVAGSGVDGESALPFRIAALGTFRGQARVAFGQTFQMGPQDLFHFRGCDVGDVFPAELVKTSNAHVARG